MPDPAAPRPNFEVDHERFERMAPIVISIPLALIALVSVPLVIYGALPLAALAGGIAILICVVVSWVLLSQGRIRAAARILVLGGHAGVCVASIASQDVRTLGFIAMIIFISLGAFLVSPRTSLGLLVSGLLALVASHYLLTVRGELVGPRAGQAITGTTGMIVMSLVSYLFARQWRRTLGALGMRVDHNTRLFTKLPDAAARLSSAAGEILEMNSQQRQGAIRQASAVDETRRSLQSLVEAAEEIAQASQKTLSDAEVTSQNADRVSESVERLAEHSQGIAELLESIRTLASKTDLLALNAALEGTKAGEAGKGFSLVAAQMQKLSLSVTAAVADIKRINKDIRSATQVSRLATDLTTKLAKATNHRAQQINLTMRQQQSSIEQISGAMKDIAKISDQFVSGADETLASTDELKNLAEQLTDVVNEFRSQAV